MIFSPAANQLLQDFNPDNQIAVFEQGDRAFVGKAPTLAEIRREEGAKVAIAWVYAQLVDLNESTSVQKMEKGQLRSTATLIVSIAYSLKISELMVFFLKLKSGEYGRFYGVVDSGLIMESLQTFIRWRNEELAAINRRVAKERERTDPQKIKIAEWVDEWYKNEKARAEDIKAKRELKKQTKPMKRITELKDNQIFVFGSNANGNHAGGAALQAATHFGAIEGQAKGLQGQSYAVVTLNEAMARVDLVEIAEQLEDLNEFARANSDKEFLMTLIGCGIAGFSIEQIKPLFSDIEWVKNIILPIEFQNLVFYKGFDSNLICRNEQFVVGNTYLKNNRGQLKLCSDMGYHFCTSLSKVHEFYSCADNSSNRFCIVEPIGEIEYDDEKCIARGIRVIRELTLLEMEAIRHSGSNNIGLFNSGYRNSGYRNSGDGNSGNRNSGNGNSGYGNSGDGNSGDRNSGNGNSGYRNSGDGNSGDGNSGDGNSGYRNSGDGNSGYGNSGYRNSGAGNSGDGNSGVFCTKKATDSITIFNQESNMTWNDWHNHPACDAVSNLPLTAWVSWSDMSEAEKSEHPKAYLQQGYLKKFGYKEAWANLWATLSVAEKNSFKDLPNFDSGIFKEITGIDF